MKKFQSKVWDWMIACFGERISWDANERNHRFLEESLELVQSLGCSREEAHQLVDYVFSRPVGQPAQEVGGVMVTLSALCSVSKLDLDSASRLELRRVWICIPKIRAKQAGKPPSSPLPQYASGGLIQSRPFKLPGYMPDEPEFVIDRGSGTLQDVTPRDSLVPFCPDCGTDGHCECY